MSNNPIEEYALGDGIRIYLPKSNLPGTWAKAKRAMVALIEEPAGNVSMGTPPQAESKPEIPPKVRTEVHAEVSHEVIKKPSRKALVPKLEAALEELTLARQKSRPLPRNTIRSIAAKHGLTPNQLYQFDYHVKKVKTFCWLCAHYVRTDPLKGTCELTKKAVMSKNNSDSMCGDFRQNNHIFTKKAPVLEVPGGITA